MKFLNVILFIVLGACLISTAAHAQEPFSSIDGSSSKETEDHSESTDTISSYIETWHFDKSFVAKKNAIMDTSLTHFHQRRLDQKQNIYVQNTGNLGSAYQSYSFFERDMSEDRFQFLKNYQSFISLPSSVVYYNTTTPYTLLDYSQWWDNRPKQQMTFHVIHTQNITPDLNFAIDYNYNDSDGRYENQASTDHAFSFAMNYEKERYKGYFSFSQNKVTQQENGGLIHPSDIQNSDLKPESYVVWMNGSQNVINDFNVSYNQKYDLGKWEKVKEKDGIYETFVPKVSLMHTIQYRDDSKNYSETEANPSYTNKSNEIFYYYGADATFNLSDSRTDDVAKERVLTNLFQIKFLEDSTRKYTFSKRAFLGIDLMNEKLPKADKVQTPEGLQWIPGVLNSENLYNLYVGGEISRENGKFWSWNLGGKYYVSGYRSQDFSLYGTMSKPIRTSKDTSFLSLSAKMSLTTPNYYMNDYMSNHYDWDNNFDKTYNLSLHVKYEKPSNHFVVGADMAFINNFVYYGTNIAPEQARSEFSVLSLHLQKDFHFGPLVVENQLVYQKSSSDSYIHLPSFVFRNSTYLNGNIYPVLQGQIGVDTYFATKYYADSYSPSLNQFYLQNDEKIGGYPVCDLFLSLKLKRVRLFMKYAFVNQLWGNTDYFTSPNYPIQPALLSFGASWSFYD